MGQKLKNLNPDAAFMYEALADSITDYLYLWDIQSNQFRVSQKMVDDFGFGSIYPEDFPTYWLSLIHEGDLERTKEIFPDFITSDRKQLTMQYQVRITNGSYIWVNSKIEIRRAPQSGEPLWAIGHIKKRELGEISENANSTQNHKLAMEDQVRRFTLKLKAILDSTPLCLNLWNTSLHNVMCNKEAVRLFNLKNEKEYTERFFELSPEYQPDGELSSEKSARYIHEAFTNGWIQFEWMHCNLKNEPIPSEITLVKIDGLDDDGGDMVAGFTRDLRPQIIAESAERKAAVRIKAALNSMPLTCILWSQDQKILDCNNVALSLFGVSSKEELCEHFDDFMPEYQPTGTLSRIRKNEIFEQTYNTGFCFVEWMYLNKDKEQIPSEVTLVKLSEDDGDIIIAYSRDLRELHRTLELNTRLTRIAYFDPLTGSASRVKFMEHLAQTFRSCNGQRTPFSVLILDFDNFKSINDTYGHDAGDMTLRTIIQKFESMLPVEGLIGRYGGDEFVIQLVGLSQDQVTILINQCIDEIAQIVLESEGRLFKTSISVGGTFFKPEDASYDTLIKRADKALYKAKNRGRNCFVLE